ncbi:p-aminobenzoyl-glutamate hydrolase subunit B [Thalassoglobus neptunius]|uniref:p-aminobenzoyl-glutamate hydrolase subunit B n=1 Tax=Thalassoglobus neptunius TaxID=1938619 RepID=A0A5C5X436_9PLAN|nr:amidohydrolase [Thalassoglobus neptunius]TWT57734.1 p-aminobenzoyl-glutamate hydrolase subunit B [Thalassoglobus neptunius]
MQILNGRSFCAPRFPIRGRCVNVMLAVIVCLCLWSETLESAPPRKRANETVTALEEIAWTNAKQIWEWAEPGYQEANSSKLLSSWLASEGFEIERGVAGIPTAFTATIGNGSPVIAILGEFDALPGLAQAAVPYKATPEGKDYGHGCGHHLFGVASATAAIAVGREILNGDIEGTVRYYGCPAEEGGSAKVFLVREGLFDDVDVALHWHPSSINAAGDRSSLARIAVKFRFHGISAHAAAAPEQARSALDAVELTNIATQMLREHVPEQTRIHHVITSGGSAPNVVPDFAEVYYYVRHPDASTLSEIYERFVKCAQAGALATETELEIVNEGGILDILPNNTLAEITLENLRQLNDLEYTSEDVKFALKLQSTLSNPKPLASVREVINRSGETSSGSTDVGDVSWVVPTTGFNTACWVPGTPGHSWQAVACGRRKMARAGMTLASRVLTATAIDLFEQPEVIKAANLEFERRRGKHGYRSLIPPDQGPPLNYRKPTTINSRD